MRECDAFGKNYKYKYIIGKAKGKCGSRDRQGTVDEFSFAKEFGLYSLSIGEP